MQDYKWELGFKEVFAGGVAGSILASLQQQKTTRCVWLRRYWKEPFKVESEVGGRKYEDVPVDEIEEGNHELLSWACQPGDVVVFHGLTLHGAK